MTIRVEVQGELISWARERARSDVEDLTRRFPRIHEWETGEVLPTLRQLEEFARVTRAPVGFLFLAEPPEEPIPLPDFRTIGDAEMRRASPDLLDTIFL